MASTDTGRQAEARAAAYLRHQDFKVREHNWHTRFCEIDIVAEKAGTVYFVEVKYRHNEKQGKGLDYITPRKLRQMRFAAELWVQEHNWRGAYELAAIGIDGEEIEFIETLDV